MGRAPACDLPIDDASISRRHARFRVHGDRCRVLDLGGRNGTFVNGELVTEVEVRHGDTVVLGRLPLHVETIDAQALAVLSDEHAMLEPAGVAVVAADGRGPVRPSDGGVMKG